jgi:hypothetical protein
VKAAELTRKETRMMNPTDRNLMRENCTARCLPTSDGALSALVLAVAAGTGCDLAGADVSSLRRYADAKGGWQFTVSLVPPIANSGEAQLRFDLDGNVEMLTIHDHGDAVLGGPHGTTRRKDSPRDTDTSAALDLGSRLRDIIDGLDVAQCFRTATDLKIARRALLALLEDRNHWSAAKARPAIEDGGEGPSGIDLRGMVLYAGSDGALCGSVPLVNPIANPGEAWIHFDLHTGFADVTTCREGVAFDGREAHAVADRLQDMLRLGEHLPWHEERESKQPSVVSHCAGKE